MITPVRLKFVSSSVRRFGRFGCWLQRGSMKTWTGRKETMASNRSVSRFIHSSFVLEPWLASSARIVRKSDFVFNLLLWLLACIFLDLVADVFG
jgi:hypothetical protein